MKRFAWVGSTLAIVLLAALAVGCTEETGQALRGTSAELTCTAHAACGLGEACLSGTCESLPGAMENAMGCASDADCPADLVCQEELCAAAGEDEEAMHCAANADCPTRATCFLGVCAVVVDADGDGWEAPADCDDWNAAICPGMDDTAEMGDGMDNDCDGAVDEGGMGDHEGGMGDHEGGMGDHEGGMGDHEGGMDDHEGGMGDHEGGMDDHEGGMDDYEGAHMGEACASDADCMMGMACVEGLCAAHEDAMGGDGYMGGGEGHADAADCPMGGHGEDGTDEASLPDDGGDDASPAEDVACASSFDCAMGEHCEDGECVAGGNMHP